MKAAAVGAPKPVHSVSSTAEMWKVEEYVYLVDLPRHVSSRAIETRLVDGKFVIETQKSLYECATEPPTIAKDSVADVQAAAAKVKTDDTEHVDSAAACEQ